MQLRSGNSSATRCATSLASACGEASSAVVLTPSAGAHARILCKRLPPGPALIVGMWGAPEHQIEGRGVAAGTWIRSAQDLEGAVNSLRNRLHEANEPAAVASGAGKAWVTQG